MTSRERVWTGLVMVLALVLVPALADQSEQLQAANDLFERQQYVAAQEALLKVDRGKLTDAERARYDNLLKLIPEAIQVSEKAAQDQAAGDKAFEAGEWDQADRLYKAVADNQYAPKAVREHATDQRARIAEKKKLAEAAKPTGTVVTQTKTDAPQLPPAQAEKAPEAAPQEPPAEEPHRLTPAEQMRLQDQLRWQRAVAQAQAQADKARAAIANKDFVEARKQAAYALQSIDQAANYAEPVAKYQTMREDMLRLKQDVEQGAEKAETEEVIKQQGAIKKQIETRRQLIEKQKRETVEQLFNSAAQLRAEKRFSEAAETLRQILRIDPANAQARYQLEVAEDYESIGQQAEWQRDVYGQTRRALVNAEEALIPWDVDVLYPRNWLELTSRRGEPGVGAGRGLEDVELNRKLNDVLPDARFDEQPLEQVIEFLAELEKVNISVDWTDLSDSSIDKEKPVTVRLTNLPFRAVLKEVLTQVGGEVKLAYAIGEGLLRIATKEKLDKDKTVLIYDIRDLLVTIPQAGRPDFTQNSQGLGQQGGGGSGGLFGQQGQQQQQQQQYGPNMNQDLIDKITDIIRQTVEPDSWRETGGGDASIRELNGQLIIYNTSDAHRQVADLLKQLREAQALQINVEARFLDVTANFLEQFGVDLDFVFNSGTAGYDRSTVFDPVTGAPVLVPRQYSRIGSFATPPAFGTPFAPTPTAPQQPYGEAAFVPPASGLWPSWNGMTPITAAQNSISMVDPLSFPTGVPGSFGPSASSRNPALNIAGSFLDNMQVDFLIRATQANAHSSIVQAPRLVIFNGQSSQIQVEHVRTYVASLTPVVGDNVALPQPIPGTVNSGVAMWVQGVISADRKYVTLSIAVRQVSDATLDRYEIQRGSGNSPTIFITLPSYSQTTLTTTVSIPDGGTVLLGGLKQVGEVELEAGVPVLSKIPVLKRAFTNSATVKDTRTLLILVKTKIIIQKEAEDEAFPTFTRTAAGT